MWKEKVYDVDTSVLVAISIEIISMLFLVVSVPCGCPARMGKG
jgi:hypothetical protein